MLNLISYISGRDITEYQDDIPYDSFLYNTDPIIVDKDTKIESGQASSNSKVSKPGKFYVISSNLKISNDVNWGGDTKSLVLGKNWNETSISIIVVKHPENKPIIIEGNNNATITLGRATILDVQSPVIFKNVNIHRAYDGPDSSIWHFGTNKKVNFPSFQVCSSSIIIRAPITLQKCNLSTGNSSGWWCDIHCITPCVPIITFKDNTYNKLGNGTHNVSKIAVCRNSKTSSLPLIKVDPKSKNKIQSFITGRDRGASGNIAIAPSVLSDIDNSEASYIPVGSFDANNGKIFYITNSNSNPIGDELDNIKIQCVQFLNKYCDYPESKNSINFEICTSPFIEKTNTSNQQWTSEDNDKKDITKYQDTVPYDSFLYNNNHNKLTANTAVSGRGVYTIDTDMKFTNSVTWGGTSNPVISNNWNNTSATVVLIKHPKNKTITIESSNNSTIFLDKGIILDIRSPVVFRNIRIYRTAGAANTRINGNKTSAGNDIWSGCMMLRAPVKFQNCTLSTPGGTGCWSDIHCLSSYAPLIEFNNNKYETKQIYIYRNMKLSTIPLLRVSASDISKFNSFIKTNGENKNISISNSILDDINNNIKYFPVGKFDQNKGKVIYIDSTTPSPTKDSNDVWYTKPTENTDNVSKLNSVKKKCIQFLKQYCGLSINNNDINTEIYTSLFANNLSTAQLLSKMGYIDVDMEASDESGFPSDDWAQTIKAGTLPLPESNSNVSEINIGVIGNSSLKVQTPDRVNTVKLNGDWSQYTGVLTIPNNISKICLSDKDLTFGINANHNIEIECDKSDTLNISGDFSKYTGSITFSNKITKIFLQTAEVPFTIGGSSHLSIGTTDPGIDSLTFKSDILKRKGKISIDPNIKTITLD